MTTSKITKKEISNTLRNGNRTSIFALAKKMGVDVSKKHLVCDFVRQYAPTQKSYNRAYTIAYEGRPYFEQKSGKFTSRLSQVISFARSQKKEGKSNYSKILIEGFSNIYWASPDYGHADYNKSIAFVKNERNIKAMQVINKYLNFE